MFEVFHSVGFMDNINLLGVTLVCFIKLEKTTRLFESMLKSQFCTIHHA